MINDNKGDMTSPFIFFMLALLIYDCAPMALEPVKPSSPPVSPPGSPVVNCSTRLLRKTINPSLTSSDASRMYPLSKMGGSTLPEYDHSDNRVNDQQSILDKLLNCSDPEISVVPIGEYNEWKNVVVMGCTLAVALEILIVLFMVVFWQQIRWTLRKITCPCDVSRRQSRRHGAMRRRSDTAGGDAVNQDTNMDDATSLDSRSSLDGPERGEASRWGTEMQIYEPTTSGAFNGSFVHRSDDDDDNGSSVDSERENPRYDIMRKSSQRESRKDGYYEIEKGHGSAYMEADCFARCSTAHGEEEYENEDGGETSEGGGGNDVSNCNYANSFVNNFREEGAEAASAVRCLNNPNNGEFLNVGERTGSKKGKESARSHRKGGRAGPIPSNITVALTHEMTPL